jgi:phosphatidylethanolamine-binding protein (PEBP) family uncharacterized protein
MGQDAGLAYRRIHFRQETGRYRAHNIRYFGVASPAGKHQFSSAVFTLPGEEQKPRPKRLSFEAMSVKYFDFNPLLDSHGQRMRRVGRVSRTFSLAGAA